MSSTHQPRRGNPSSPAAAERPPGEEPEPAAEPAPGTAAADQVPPGKEPAAEPAPGDRPAAQPLPVPGTAAADQVPPGKEPAAAPAPGATAEPAPSPAAPDPPPGGRRTPRLPGADEERFQPADRAAWRAWLEANHATATGVWVVSFRRSSGKRAVDYLDLIEEALCFGWIDSQGGSFDAERRMLRFTPRRKGSGWARTNKERVERLIAAGAMAPAGLRAIEAAKADGSWTVLDDAEALRIPADLETALAADPAAAAGFGAMSPSVRKMILFWVLSAKREETRARRIAQLVRDAAAGRNPLERPARPPQG